MFPTPYFPDRYFAPRYWPKVGAVLELPPSMTFGVDVLVETAAMAVGVRVTSLARGDGVMVDNPSLGTDPKVD